ncbi:hypothetical protein [Methyloglobulus sp.]|uniref:hypothetical protein n=1 Tax=Methyloglobulus sp. TaxID=2518622 RepID=UPI003989650E
MKSGQLQINGLTAILNQHFQWNKARMDCFVGILVALMGVGTQLALAFPRLGADTAALPSDATVF